MYPLSKYTHSPLLHCSGCPKNPVIKLTMHACEILIIVLNIVIRAYKMDKSTLTVTQVCNSWLYVT